MKKKEGFDGQQAIVLPRKVINECMKLPVVNNLFITDIGYYPKANFHYRKRENGCEQHILLYCVNGHGSAIVNRKHYDINPFDFLIIPASHAHIYQANQQDPWTLYWLHFRGDSSDFLSQLLYKKMLAGDNYVKFNEEIRHLFQNIYSLLQTGYSVNNLIFSSLSLHYFLSSFIFPGKFTLAKNMSSTDSIDTAIQFLKNNVHRVISLSEVASKVNLSASHFSGLFRKKTGFSPIDYFNQLKMQQACQLLQFTDQRVNEVALAIGIEDSYYFSRLFTTMMGMSPKAYRNKKEIKKQ